MHPNFFRWLPHGPQPLHVLQTLHNNGTLKEKEHTKVKETVIPVFIKKPKQGAKKLKHEKRRHKMLLVQLQEAWNRNVHLVAAPNEIGLADGFLVFDAFGRLVVLDRLLDWVGNRLKCVFRLAPDHPLLHVFDAVDRLQVSWAHFDRFLDYGYHLLFGSFLFLVVNLHPHM
jgi:hypothetical protein